MFSQGTAPKTKNKQQQQQQKTDSVWNCQDEQWNGIWRSFEHFRVAWGIFIQTGTFDSHARLETRFCHTGPTNTSSLWFVDTFDKLQTSIQHNYACDFMNMKENILFLRNEWTTTAHSKHWFTTAFLPLEEGDGKRCSECATTGEVDKTDRTREMYSPIRQNTRKQWNTSAFDRKLSSSGARKIDNNKRRRNQRRRQTRSWRKKEDFLLLLFVFCC